VATPDEIDVDEVWADLEDTVAGAPPASPVVGPVVRGWPVAGLCMDGELGGVDDSGGAGALPASPLVWTDLEDTVEPVGELDTAVGPVVRGWPGATEVTGTILAVFIVVQWVPQVLGMHVLRWAHLNGFFLLPSPVPVSTIPTSAASKRG
jgi:hypothetical protein